jgi:hypothetical protein
LRGLRRLFNLARGQLVQSLGTIVIDKWVRTLPECGELDRGEAALGEAKAVLARFRECVRDRLDGCPEVLRDDVERIVSALSVEIGAVDASDFASLLERVDAILSPSWAVETEIESRWGELARVVDTAVANAELGTPLKIFESAWSKARTGGLPRSNFSERIRALREAAESDDIATLGRLLGGCDASRVLVQHGRGAASSRDGFSLLEIACQARAGASARFLLEFMGCPATVAALHAAIAGGDPELVLLIWDRLDVQSRSNAEELAETAGNFHQWLVFD